MPYVLISPISLIKMRENIIQHTSRPDCIIGMATTDHQVGYGKLCVKPPSYVGHLIINLPWNYIGWAVRLFLFSSYSVTFHQASISTNVEDYR